MTRDKFCEMYSVESGFDLSTSQINNGAELDSHAFPANPPLQTS